MCNPVNWVRGNFFMVTAQFVQTRLSALLIGIATVSLITLILRTQLLEINDTMQKVSVPVTECTTHK